MIRQYDKTKITSSKKAIKMSANVSVERIRKIIGMKIDEHNKVELAAVALHTETN